MFVSVQRDSSFSPLSSDMFMSRSCNERHLFVDKSVVIIFSLSDLDQPKLLPLRSKLKRLGSLPTAKASAKLLISYLLSAALSMCRLVNFGKGASRRSATQFVSLLCGFNSSSLAVVSIVLISSLLGQAASRFIDDVRIPCAYWTHRRINRMVNRFQHFCQGIC